jgi:hypothetical protein
MPTHDKDGLIEGLIQMQKKPMYIVTYEEHPYLRVSVKPQNILDWVSPRTLENWEFAKTQAEDKKLRDELLPKIAARERRRRLKEQGGSMKASRVKEAQQGTKSRKRKRTPSPKRQIRTKSLSASGMGMSDMAPPSGSSRRRKQVDEEEQAVHNAPRRPSLSTPVRQRSLVDFMDYETEDEDSLAEEAAQLEHQLNGTPLHGSKLAIEISRSETSTPEVQPLKIQKIKKPPVPAFDRRETRSGSISSTPGARRRETHNSSASGPSRRDSVAATSSREARVIYEKLERKAKASTLTEKYSYSGEKPSKSTQKAISMPSTQKTSTPQRKQSATPKPTEEDDEEEYEVDVILADEYRIDKKGKRILYFLIKWVGEWPNSWEPEENVGVDAIAEYKEKKRAKQERIGRSMNLDGASSGAEGMFIDRKGKGRAMIPSDAGDLKGGEADESDEDSLFVKDRSRGTYTVAEKATPKKVAAPRRGEVIDDEASFSDEF